MNIANWMPSPPGEAGAGNVALSTMTAFAWLRAGEATGLGCL